MTSKFLPFAVIASVMMGGAAFAGTTTASTATAPAASASMPAKTTASAPVKVVSKIKESKGVIKSIDAKAMTVTLAGGKVYHLPAGFNVAGFKVGEKVQVTWSAKGKLHEATGMTAL